MPRQRKRSGQRTAHEGQDAGHGGDARQIQAPPEETSKDTSYPSNFMFHHFPTKTVSLTHISHTHPMSEPMFKNQYLPHRTSQCTALPEKSENKPQRIRAHGARSKGHAGQTSSVHEGHPDQVPGAGPPMPSTWWVCMHRNLGFCSFTLI